MTHYGNKSIPFFASPDEACIERRLRLAGVLIRAAISDCLDEKIEIGWWFDTCTPELLVGAGSNELQIRISILTEVGSISDPIAFQRCIGDHRCIIGAEQGTGQIQI